MIEPYNVAARMELAASLRERAQWSLAEEQYDRVIDQEPDHVSAHLFRGVVRYELGHVDGAIADLAWAVQRTEVVPWDAWMTLGRAYRENGEYELARAALERAVQWRGSLPDPWLELAAVCQELDDSNCATHSLSRALTLAPMHPDRDALADRMRALGGTSWVVDTPTSTLPLSDVMDVYTVQVRFDQIPAQLVVDTGAAMTTISGDLATDLGLDDVEAMQRLTFSTAGGPVEMPIHRIGTLELGAMRFYDVQVSVCEACDGFDADGLLGMNVLGQVGLSLDAERGEVTIW